MAIPLRINALIAQFPAGLVPPPSGQGPASPASAPQDFGPAVVRQSSASVSPDGRPPLVYSRKDALGQSSATPPNADAGREEESEEASFGNLTDEAANSREAGSPVDSVTKPNGELLSKAETAVLRELQKADLAVRDHEMAHLAVAGGYARGGATFSYQRGPDGRNYAVGGEVQIDTGKEATPEATIVKMQIVRQAALAPADPSPQDQRVAAHATLQIAEASKELMISRVSQAQPPASEQPEGEEKTTRDIYRQAGREIGQGDDIVGGPPPQKAFSAYQAFRPSSVENGQSSIDHIA